MNLNLQSSGVSGGGRRRQDGIALVITLLMLSVITFLAVAFLAMTRRDRAAVTASMDVNGARTMSEAAFARAQGEIIARMMAQTDWLSYDYMVSQNYINPNGFNTRSNDTGNVNYDYNATLHRPMSSQPPYDKDWAQNIADLFYDPRPPVFVVTNANFPTNSDFRFWVDVNRNGRFETNGYIPTVTNEAAGGLPLGPYQVWNGEPEWIGVLSDPLSRHSSSNKFIGRYAYMVLPIGKTLDFNFIHNWAKGNYVNSVTVLTNNVGPVGPLTGLTGNPESDGFARDQGVGSWELNLAAMLDVLSPWAYEYNPYYSLNPYYYVNPSASPGGPNTGYAFDDAESIVHYRYWGPKPFLASLRQDYSNYLNFEYDNIDSYCASAPLTAPFNYTNDPDAFLVNRAAPWPGSYSTNMFYDPQDLFDPTKTSFQFTNRMLLAEARTNFFDRYTFQRLLQCIGTGSSPEYGVFVYSNSITTNSGAPPTWLRTKINLNYNNTAQIQDSNAPFVPMPTNLTSWAPLAFFTNAADLLLRSQEFPVANYISLIGPSNYVTNYAYMHFGITNIPIFNSTNSSIRYNAQIHRMLQLAANIYDANVCGSSSNTLAPVVAGDPTVFVPHIFRPQFYALRQNGTTNLTVSITNYAIVNSTNWAFQAAQPFYNMNDPNSKLYRDPNNGRDCNILGVPWVVGTVKGLPSFNQFSTVNSIEMTRKLTCWRRQTNTPPDYTNQFYDLSISNLIGAQVWNPYSNAYPRQVTCYVSNFATVVIENSSPLAPYLYISNYYITVTNLTLNYDQWAGFSGRNRKRSMLLPLLTNVISFPDAYYSEHNRAFFNMSGSPTEYLPADYYQTSFPVHSWVVNVTNSLLYCMYDGSPNSPGPLLDFVNLGPLGTSLDLIGRLTNGILGNPGGTSMFPVGNGNNPDSSTIVWNTTGASDSPGSAMSQGELAQMRIGEGPLFGGIAVSDWPPAYPPEPSDYYPGLEINWYHLLSGTGTNLTMDCPFQPTVYLEQSSTWQANDPLVHYTVDDLSWPEFQSTNLVQYVRPATPALASPTNYTHLGQVPPPRYEPWNWPNSAIGNNWLFKDPMATNVDSFDFPTNKFPGIGWLGRVHRGTPWQTVYFKPDSPNPNDAITWLSNWSGTLGTYPTNDYVLADLFTAVPNDNAARGLLSINQTNDAAWAAVFAGLVVPTNAFYGVTVAPTNIYALVDATNGINATRANEPNGLFHRLGYLFKTPALTVQSPFLTNASLYSDEVVERIPQQILSLVKLGDPQFVIYAWGQSLRPKSFYYGTGLNFNICTNYEITGEVLTRTVCHMVSDPLATSPKIVIDSFNIEAGN